MLRACAYLRLAAKLLLLYLLPSFADVKPNHGSLNVNMLAALQAQSLTDGHVAAMATACP